MMNGLRIIYQFLDFEALYLILFYYLLIFLGICDSSSTKCRKRVDFLETAMNDLLWFFRCFEF